jgi:Protein of unknown function (DUF2914)
MSMPRLFFLSCCYLLVLIFCALPQRAAADGLKITEMAVTTKIVRGNPIDSVRRISSASVKALYCFTRVASESDGETTIKHLWYKDGEKVADYELPVKGQKWRTYSKKAVEKGLTGDWRVDAVDSEGKLLKSVKFKMN